MILFRARPLLALGAVFALLATWMGPAQAQIQQPAVVGIVPASYTPNLASDGVIKSPAAYAIAQLGSTMYIGGHFGAIQDVVTGPTYPRKGLVSFGATTGVVSTTFTPAFDKAVWALQGSADGTSLYVGGDFTTVNGGARRGLAKINPATGALDTNFKPVTISSGYVREIKLVNGHLIVGGSFPKKLVSLNPLTGIDDNFINLAIAGTVASNAGPTHLYRFAVNPAGTRLVAVGNFVTVNGLTRSRAFMVNLDTTPATLSNWYYQPLTRMCLASSLPQYLRDVDFSPDGTYFVIVSTGFVSQTGDFGATLCDAAARFETGTLAPFRPTWINYTGGDTLHSVAVTGVAVYVNGHNRWLDNPYGRDSCGDLLHPGCSSRPGIGAIDPNTGLALSWNPTKTRGVGGKDLLATSSPGGLWVASDGKMFNYKFHWGIAFVPLP